MGRIQGGQPKTIDIKQNCNLCFLMAFLVLGSSNIESFDKNIRKKDLTSLLAVADVTFAILRDYLLYTQCFIVQYKYRLHILIVSTFLSLFLICK